MSSRALRQLQRQRELEMAQRLQQEASDSSEASSSGEEAPVFAAPKRVNTFAMLMGVNEDDTSSSEESDSSSSSSSEDEAPIRRPARSAPPASRGRRQAPAAAPLSKKQQKKAQRQSKLAASTQVAAETEVPEASKTPAAQPRTGAGFEHPLSASLFRAAFGTQPNKMDANAELRRFFGSDVIGHSSSGMGGGNLVPFRHNRGHPSQRGRSTRPGLQMTPLSPAQINQDGRFFYCFTPTQVYLQVQQRFEALLGTHNYDQIHNLFHDAPFHAPTALTVAEMLRRQGSAPESDDVIERIIFDYEVRASSQFQPYRLQKPDQLAESPDSVVPAGGWLSYDVEMNRSLFLALFHRVSSVARTGAHRAALEAAKALFCLNPLDDPLASVLLLDHCAVRAREDSWLLSIYDSFCDVLGLHFLPSYAFSLALCTDRVENGTADSAPSLIQRGSRKPTSATNKKASGGAARSAANTATDHLSAQLNMACSGLARLPEQAAGRLWAAIAAFPAAARALWQEAGGSPADFPPILSAYADAVSSLPEDPANLAHVPLLTPQDLDSDNQGEWSIAGEWYEFDPERVLAICGRPASLHPAARPTDLAQSLEAFAGLPHVPIVAANRSVALATVFAARSHSIWREPTTTNWLRSGIAAVARALCHEAAQSPQTSGTDDSAVSRRIRDLRLAAYNSAFAARFVELPEAYRVPLAGGLAAVDAADPANTAVVPTIPKVGPSTRALSRHIVVADLPKTFGCLPPTHAKSDLHPHDPLPPRYEPVRGYALNTDASVAGGASASAASEEAPSLLSVSMNAVGSMIQSLNPNYVPEAGVGAGGSAASRPCPAQVANEDGWASVAPAPRRAPVVGGVGAPADILRGLMDLLMNMHQNGANADVAEAGREQLMQALGVDPEALLESMYDPAADEEDQEDGDFDDEDEEEFDDEDFDDANDDALAGPTPAAAPNDDPDMHSLDAQISAAMLRDDIYEDWTD